MSRILYPALTQPVLTAAQRPEQVTESRWHQPLSEPVRLRALPAAVIVASGIFWAPVTPSTEIVTLDKWYRPYVTSVPRGGMPVWEQPYLSFVKAAPFGESVSIDRWLQPLSQPMDSRRLPRVVVFPALSFSYTLVAAAPAATVVHMRGFHVNIGKMTEQC